jgi:hypothetical protein
LRVHWLNRWNRIAHGDHLTPGTSAQARLTLERGEKSAVENRNRAGWKQCGLAEPIRRARFFSAFIPHRGAIAPARRGVIFLRRSRQIAPASGA